MSNSGSSGMPGSVGRRHSKRLSMAFRRQSSLLSRSASSSKSSSRTTVSFSDINADILLLVLQHLNWPEDYYNLGLVSRSFHDSVIPELYRTIIITPNPRRTLGLLEKLERDEQCSASVQVLIFDNVVRSLRPRIPAAEDFGQARKKDLTDDPSLCGDEYRGDPHRIRLRLYSVIPKLSNLQTLCVKRWSHIIQGPLSPAECYNYWQPDPIKSKTLKTKLKLKTKTRGPPSVMDGDRRPCPLDVITFLLRRCTHLENLYIVGTYIPVRFSVQYHPQNSPFTNLQVLVIGERSPCPKLWNGILKSCKALRVFGLLGVHFRFEKLISGCYFPKLESIEWYNYAFSSSSSRKPAKAFADFIQKHSSTLKCVSLVPRLCQPRGFPYDGGVRFFDPEYDLLPNLETLRLQNWTVFSPHHDMWPHMESRQSRALAEEICRFVAKRPKIVDITITDMPADLAVRLTDEILANRQMKRVLVGESLQRSEEEHVPLESSRYELRRSRWRLPGGMLRREQSDWLVTRKVQYLREAWRSYELSFQGLALEQSGYRPWLLHSKCPRHWSDYLRR